MIIPSSSGTLFWYHSGPQTHTDTKRVLILPGSSRSAVSLPLTVCVCVCYPTVLSHRNWNVTLNILGSHNPWAHHHICLALCVCVYSYLLHIEDRYMFFTNRVRTFWEVRTFCLALTSSKSCLRVKTEG